MGLIRNLFNRIDTGGGVLFSPQALPNLELYLDSRLGVTGADGSTVTAWPNQASTGTARDGLPDTGNGNAGNVILKKNAPTSPSGVQTLLFSGVDFPSAPVFRSRTAFQWPSISQGYTLYFGFNR